MIAITINCLKLINFCKASSRNNKTVFYSISEEWIKAVFTLTPSNKIMQKFESFLLNMNNRGYCSCVRLILSLV